MTPSRDPAGTIAILVDLRPWEIVIAVPKELIAVI